LGLFDVHGGPALEDATALPLPAQKDRSGGYSSYVQIPIARGR
jgi:hypothetical protein